MSKKAKKGPVSELSLIEAVFFFETNHSSHGSCTAMQTVVIVGVGGIVQDPTLPGWQFVNGDKEVQRFQIIAQTF